MKFAVVLIGFGVICWFASTVDTDDAADTGMMFVGIAFIIAGIVWLFKSRIHRWWLMRKV